MWIPQQYQTLNGMMASRMPNSLHDCDSTTNYFERYFAQKAASVLDLDIPKEWDKDFFLYCLIMFGYVVVTDTDWNILQKVSGFTASNGLDLLPARLRRP